MALSFRRHKDFNNVVINVFSSLSYSFSVRRTVANLSTLLGWVPLQSQIENSLSKEVSRSMSNIAIQAGHHRFYLYNSHNVFPRSLDSHTAPLGSGHKSHGPFNFPLNS